MLPVWDEEPTTATSRRGGDGGAMVGRRSSPSYQLFGANGSIPGIENICHGSESVYNLVQVRQCNSSDVPQSRGGVHSNLLCSLASEIWDWCLNQGITLIAEHLPGLDNTKQTRSPGQIATGAIGNSVFQALEQ